MKELENKTVVITGATKGIGKAVADRLEKKNTVIRVARHIEDDGKQNFSCDVSDGDAVFALFDRIYSVHGHIDLLLNNVGEGLTGAVEFLDKKYLDEIVKVNLMSVVYCTKAALMHEKQAFKIVNMSSIASLGVQPFRTMYTATKAAVSAFTVGMRQELYGSDVDVCAITMGDAVTDFGKHHHCDFTSSERYGNRLDRGEQYGKKRTERSSKPKDRRMPVDKAAKGICRVLSKKRFGKYTYFIGFKYKALYVVSRFFTMEGVSNIVRMIFE